MVAQDPDLAAPDICPTELYHLTKETKGIGSQPLPPLAINFFLLVLPLIDISYEVLESVVAFLYHLLHHKCINHTPFQISQSMGHCRCEC